MASIALKAEAGTGVNSVCQSIGVIIVPHQEPCAGTYQLKGKFTCVIVLQNAILNQKIGGNVSGRVVNRGNREVTCDKAVFDFCSVDGSGDVNSIVRTGIGSKNLAVQNLQVVRCGCGGNGINSLPIGISHENFTILKGEIGRINVNRSSQFINARQVKVDVLDEDVGSVNINIGSLGGREVDSRSVISIPKPDD